MYRDIIFFVPLACARGRSQRLLLCVWKWHTCAGECVALDAWHTSTSSPRAGFMHKYTEYASQSGRISNVQAYSRSMERRLLAMAESPEPPDPTSTPALIFVLVSIVVIVPALMVCGICGEKPPKRNTTQPMNTGRSHPAAVNQGVPQNRVPDHQRGPGHSSTPSIPSRLPAVPPGSCYCL